MRSILKREAIIFGVLLLIGLILVPIAIYLAGAAVFDNYYSYDSLGTFLGRFYGELGGFNRSLWFIVASPWLAIQCLRFGIKLSKPRVVA